MLLARAGHRVLLVDRARFPSDSLSTHYIHQSGVAQLARWGLLDRIADAYSLRRDKLDAMLVAAAEEAGAEIRQGFAIDELIVDRGRIAGVHSRGRSARARLVIGADGLNSIVARTAGAPVYGDHGTLTCAYYTYWSGVEIDAAELYVRPGNMIVAAPTNDGQAVTIVLWPNAEFHAVRRDIERRFMQALELAPRLAERVAGATRTDRFRGTARLPNHYRRAHGDGWALVGDAGYHKDPILALGISDAFRDAELLAEAVDAALTGAAPMPEALAGYERRRNELSAPGFQATVEFARLQPPPPDTVALLSALRHLPEDRDRFFGTFAGTVDHAEFFSPENLGRIVGGAAVAA